MRTNLNSSAYKVRKKKKKKMKKMKKVAKDLGPHERTPSWRTPLLDK